MSRLPIDLQRYATEDNGRLLEELRQWNLSKAVISAEQSSKPAADIVSAPEMGPRK